MDIFKTAKKKYTTGVAAYNEEGFIGLGLKTMEYLQKRSRRKGPSRRKMGIETEATYSDILSVDLSKPANAQWKAPRKPAQKLTINWLMPPPGKGSGGHMTIWRFLSYLEAEGHTCRIYFHKPGKGSSVEAVLQAMDGSFTPLKAEMRWLQTDEEMEPADALVATSWQTAYSVYNSTVKSKKFYFVQDFEPFFYPVGGLSVLAENTYKLGLRGITAGGWLETKLRNEYRMVTSSFNFGSDSDIYHYENGGERKEITFYARPITPRRAFELGIATLDLFHRMHPEYTINFIGWDVSDFSIPFPHNNLGILSPVQLNEVYNRSAASLVMSLTNMSLLPLELLASGCIPVVTDGDNNRLVSNDPYIAYSEKDPLSMAQTLSAIVTRKDLPAHAKKASKSVQGCDWGVSGKKVVKTFVDSVNSDGSA